MGVYDFLLTSPSPLRLFECGGVYLIAREPGAPDVVLVFAMESRIKPEESYTTGNDEIAPPEEYFPIFYSLLEECFVGERCFDG